MTQLNMNLDTPLSDIELKRKEVLGEEWFLILREQLNHPKVRAASKFVGERRNVVEVFPSREDTFRAFKETPYKNVKLVALSQDPYHNGTADGLAFSTRSTERPKSLQIIVNAIVETTNQFPVVNDLTEWAKQGVFLLNSVLTVERGLPNSHKGKGWEELTNFAIRSLSKRREPICYFLFGADAKSAKQFIVNPEHLIIECEHPAAALYQNREWKHNDCFNKCNDYLKKNGIEPIKWDAVNYDPINTPF